MMELIGRQFGHIRVTEVVGEGGMGAVYAGYDEKLDRKVALKVLHAEQRLDDEARDRLLREARALSKVEHPNICRIHDYIETGDIDLLVLEYIDGRTLDTVIADGLPKSEKLRIARSVAEVLVRAHRAGIVHRDLKPENVMLTKGGEVKVLDFGLARWFKDRRRSSDRLVAVRDEQIPVRKAANEHHDTAVLPPMATDRSGRREFLATAAGTTLGTPLYMSPEQARGETLTPASDMFAFGLLLQVLFTGKEPHPETASAREVILRVARGETNPVDGAPKDIGSLINNLKQLAPPDRLTAVQTVERLQYIIGAPQRIVRRTTAAAVLTIMLAGAWRYTVDLQQERAEAQKQRAQAEDLIGFMVGDLREKLEPVGRLDVLDDVAEKALQYVKGLDPETMSVDQLTRNAKALNQLGEVRMGQGKTPEAATLFQQSLALSDLAVKRDPKDPEALMVYGASHYWLGDAFRLQGKKDDALRHWTEYQRIGMSLAALDPAKKEYQLERSYGHSNVASLFDERGLVAEALPHHRASLEITKNLAAADPSLREPLAIAYNKAGVSMARTGDLRGAIEHLRQESAILRELAANDSQNMRLKQRLATNMAYLARWLSVTGDEAGALALWREELSIETALAERDPDDVVKQRAVAVTTRRIAGIEAHAGDSARALDLYRNARRAIATVVHKAPAQPLYAVDSAAVDVDYAVALSAAGQRETAVEILRGAIERIEALPSPPRGAQIELGRAYTILGETVADRTAADTAWRHAEMQLEPLVASSADPLELALWTRVLIHRNRFSEARTVMGQIARTGFVLRDLETLCRESGC